MGSRGGGGRGAILVCETATWSIDPTSGCINNRVCTGPVSVYIWRWWTSSASSLPLVPPARPLRSSKLPCTWSLWLIRREAHSGLFSWLSAISSFAAWPVTGNGVHEQRLEQLRFWRHRQCLLNEHDHQWPASPGERSQNERSAISSRQWHAQVPNPEKIFLCLYICM